MATETFNSDPGPADAKPVACTLAADDQKTRLEGWRELRRDGLVTEIRAGRVLTTFWRRSGDIPNRLETLIEAEKQCCSFLEFELEEAADVVRVRTVFPEGAEGLLEAFSR